MPDLPEVREKFVADTSGYSSKLREAARDADKFSNQNSQAALAARKMGLAAKEAADKAARAMSAAGKAAEDAAMGMGSADEAAQAEARALREMERAAIKAAEAERAVAHAAEDAARQQRQAARDAELAGAAQKLSALKASGAVKEHNALLHDLESRYGDLSKEGSGAFQEIGQASESAFADVGSSGPGVIALVVGALAAVPVAATAAESAISLGVGGALAGIGLEATKSDVQVQTALHNMTSHIKSETAQIAAPFKQTWLDIAETGKETFDKLAPTLKQDFAELAPALSDFVHDAGVAAQRLAPAFDAGTRASDKLLHALGDRLPDIAGNVGKAITIMANSAGQHAEEFANLVQNVSALAPVLAHVIDYVTQFGSVVNPMFDVLSHGQLSVSAFRGALENLSGGLIKSDHSFQTTTQTFPTFAQQATIAAAGAHQLMTAQQAAALSSQQLKQALDSLTGANANAFDATTQYKQALLAANQQAKASNAGIRGNSAAAIANRTALSSMAGAIRNVMQNANPTSAAINTMRSRFISAAEGMGVSRSAAVALANKLLGVKAAANSIPGSRTIHLNDNASSVRGHIAALQASINQLHGRTVTIDYIETVHRTLQAERARADGGIVKLADGGMPRRRYPSGGQVSGPGTSTSDSIPALLSDGEFVVNAKQTAKWLPVLEEINAGVNGYAKGGKSVGIGKMEKAQIARLNAAKARVSLARSRPEYVAAMAAQQALASMRSSVYGGFFRGGPATVGSAHGTVVQHVTNVTLNVQGSVRTDRDLVQMVQRSLITNRMPVSLPAGR